MKLYSCKVRLHGEVKDEVHKVGVTSAEMKILKVIHGDDAVVDVKQTGEVERSESKERERLEMIYGEKRVVQSFGARVASMADEPEAESQVAEPVVEVMKQPDPATLPVVEQTPAEEREELFA
jgi:hypothetical protein